MVWERGYCVRNKDIIKTIAQNKLEFSESITKKITEVKARNNQLKTKACQIDSDNVPDLLKHQKEQKSYDRVGAKITRRNV